MSGGDGDGVEEGRFFLLNPSAELLSLGWLKSQC